MRRGYDEEAAARRTKDTFKLLSAIEPLKVRFLKTSKVVCARGPGLICNVAWQQSSERPVKIPYQLEVRAVFAESPAGLLILTAGDGFDLA